MNPESQERQKLESSRNMLLHEIRNTLLHAVKLSEQPGYRSHELDAMVIRYNYYNNKLGLPEETKDELLQKILQEAEEKSHADRPSISNSDISDTDVDQAFDAIQKDISATADYPIPFVDPLADTSPGDN